jgi:hypothetical protein
MGGFRKFLVFMKLAIFENKKCGVSIDEQPQGSANRPVGHSQNLGLIHTAVMKMIMIIIQKRLGQSQIRILIIYMGISLTTFLGRNGPSSGSTYIKIYKGETLHYKLFEFN